MPVSDDLLARYERDWGEAMEQYEASLRSERMANVNYDPSSRIFEASQPTGSAERLRAAFLDPIQAKWGPLLGRSAAKPTATGSEWSAPMNVGRGGVVQVNRTTGQVRTNRTQDAFGGPLDPFQKEAASVRAKKLSSDISSLDREMTEQRKALSESQKIKDANKRYIAELKANSNLLELQRRRDALFAGNPESKSSAAPAQPTYFLPPESIPFGAPKDPSIFMGDPRRPVIQDPPMAPLANDPFQSGPSTSRGLRILSIKQR